MTLYIVELNGWDTYQQFGIFQNKENAKIRLLEVVEKKNHEINELNEGKDEAELFSHRK